MEYLHVLSRPMVINHDHDIIWTEAYMDTVVGQCGAISLLAKELLLSSLNFTQCAACHPHLSFGSSVITCFVSLIHIANVIHNHFIPSSSVSLSSLSPGHRSLLSLPLRL